jgi:hypothetical protein
MAWSVDPVLSDELMPRELVCSSVDLRIWRDLEEFGIRREEIEG